MKVKWAVPVLASILILGTIGFSQDAFAATFNSNLGGGTGFWSDPATWDAGSTPPGGFDPTISDTVIITSGDTVILNFNSYFACGDDITVEPGATLQIPVPGILTLSSFPPFSCPPSSLINQGTIVDDNSLFVLSGNTFENEGTIDITGALLTSTHFLNSGTINIFPFPTIDSLGRLGISSTDGSLTNECGATINVNGGDRFQSGLLQTDNQATVTNLGTVNLMGGAGEESGSWENKLNIQNHGAINGIAGAGVNSGQVNNKDSGTITDLPDVCAPPPIDTDGDGVDDSVDNCPLDPNADQADSNNNGVGDVCDSETLLIAQLQADNNALQASLTVCQNGLNQCQADNNVLQTTILTLQNTITDLQSEVQNLLDILVSGDITICHKDKTQIVSVASLGNHLNHGDTIGACESP